MKKLTFLAVAAMLLLATSAFGENINVLWYTGGVSTSPTYFSSYDAALAGLAADAGTDGPNTWTITKWDGGAMPTGTFNVLVTTSPEGGWGTYPNFSALTAAAPTFGDRIMITGQDADWHFMNGPGPSSFDGPQGFLVDSINWAGSGTGMGAVFLGDTSVAGNFFSGYSYLGGSSNSVTIPAAYATYPINQGLTSAGLSNWNTSAHDTYGITDSSKWVGINLDGSSSSQFVTIVSAETVAGGTTPVPEPGSIMLLGTGLIGLAGAIRRKMQK